jgi:subtilisin family serine protease
LTIKKFLFVLGLASVVVLSFYVQSPASNKIRIRPNSLQSDSVKVWVFFHDKGNTQIPLSKKAAVNDKAMLRRIQRGSIADYDTYDREVNPEYVIQIVPLVKRVAQTSRWLNAVSAWTTPSGLGRLAELEFVDSVKEVAVFVRKPEPTAEADTMRLLKPESPYPPDYGESYPQAAQIEVDQLHNRSLTGTGVTILMLDTGFKISHAAFARMNIDSTRDFINNDVNVEDPNDPSENGFGISQQSHGTATLSIIGGYDYGNMIGVAYDADFLLAKTEITSQEIKAEEDNWVAGIEWGERLGADVVSSSLGYDNWYAWEDKDGQTATCTIAATIAARHGLVVVNAVGNGGRTSPHPTIITPADGDSVIAVGAVSLGGEIAGFSSNGPTFDGRIKPDVCALGESDRIANQSGGYGNGSGTSFATPLVAGACALLLQAHPNWHYGDLYRAITGTATQSATPDTVYGYGIIRAYHALHFGSDTTATFRISGKTGMAGTNLSYVDGTLKSATSNTDATYTLVVSYDWTGTVMPTKTGYTFMPDHLDIANVLEDISGQDFIASSEAISGVVAAPNPFTGSVDFVFSLKTAGEAKYRIYDIAGEKIAEKSASFTLSGGASSSIYRLSWDGQNYKGDQAAAGVYIVYFASPGIETTLKVFKKE